MCCAITLIDSSEMLAFHLVAINVIANLAEAFYPKGLFLFFSPFLPWVRKKTTARGMDRGCLYYPVWIVSITCRGLRRLRSPR